VKAKKRKTLGWTFVIPATLMIVIFNFVPMIQSFILSLKKGSGMNMTFVGLDNYKRLFQDKIFKMTLSNTFIYLILEVAIMLIAAMLLASLLNDKRLKCKGLFRLAIFLPCATSLVSYSIIFRSLFSMDGFMNTILMNLHVISAPMNWLGNTWTARIVIVIALLWRWTGYNMIFFLAALQNIDGAIYEAAVVDGANAFQKFTKITIPMLRPTILLTAIMSTNGTLQLFDESVNITNGGPANTSMSISHYIYNLSFAGNPNFGYASAISYVVFILVAILAFMQMRVGDDK
jgi:lactose/L-arabinose transport system permease protein